MPPTPGNFFLLLNFFFSINFYYTYIIGKNIPVLNESHRNKSSRKSHLPAVKEKLADDYQNHIDVMEAKYRLKINDLQKELYEQKCRNKHLSEMEIKYQSTINGLQKELCEEKKRNKNLVEMEAKHQLTIKGLQMKLSEEEKRNKFLQDQLIASVPAVDPEVNVPVVKSVLLNYKINVRKSLLMTITFFIFVLLNFLYS